MDANNYYSVRKIQKLAVKMYNNQLIELPFYGSDKDDITLPSKNDLYEGLGRDINGEFLVQDHFIEFLNSIDPEFAKAVVNNCKIN